MAILGAMRPNRSIRPCEPKMRTLNDPICSLGDLDHILKTYQSQMDTKRETKLIKGALSCETNPKRIRVGPKRKRAGPRGASKERNILGNKVQPKEGK